MLISRATWQSRSPSNSAHSTSVTVFLNCFNKLPDAHVFRPLLRKHSRIAGIGRNKTVTNSGLQTMSNPDYS